MAEVTVEQLAGVVGVPVERLLQQMEEAGLPHGEADQLVSDDDKQTLLGFLKSAHGESDNAPKKITLKRRTISKLKTGSRSQSKRTVNVEIRRKRTYVKRDDVASEAANAPKDQALDETLPLTAESSGLDAASAGPFGDETLIGVKVDELGKVDSAHKDDKLLVDPELPRQAAATRRREKEEEELERREAALKARRQREEEESKRTVEVVARARVEAEQAREDGSKPVKETKPAAKAKRGRKELDDDQPRRKTEVRRGRGEAVPLRLGAVLSAEDYELVEEQSLRRQRRRLHRSAELERMTHSFELPTEKSVREIEVSETIVISELAQRMAVKSAEVVRYLMSIGVMSTVNQIIDQDTAALVVDEFGHTLKQVSTDAVEEQLSQILDENGNPEPRAPVVTVMGHVDHGKTSLLDYIRKTRVASGEAGGITQHIGAYHVETGHGMITFLDTPGHAAFTAMRARGARSTDIVVLVVAADDGVMPQTEEAIQHARAAEVPIIVAVNKIDKESADPERVKNELSVKGVIPEDWGGDVQFVSVSAQTGESVDKLLDAILLQAEVLELQTPRDVAAQGIVLESRLDKGRGSVASILVQRGLLNHGDIVIAGTCSGRVRAMMDEAGNAVSNAGPSIPVEILGLDGTPDAGEPFAVVESERQAREVTLFRQDKQRVNKLAGQQAARLDTLFSELGDGVGSQSLNVLVKADVRGSLEAIRAALLEIGNEEVQVNIVSGGVGGISETDVNLAVTTGAVVLGFNVRADGAARKVVEQEGLDMRYYSVIYNLVDDVRNALSGMLSPEMREEILGVAEVRESFSSPKFGTVAGCMVVEGTVLRHRPIRVLRDNVVIYEGELESLRRFKEDANEVRNGLECGIGVKNYNDVRVGDKIEVYQLKEVARAL